MNKLINKKLTRLLLLILTVTLFVSCGENKQNSEKVIKNKIELNEYGLKTDSLIEHDGVVLRNENLSDILLPFGVGYKKILELSDSSKPVFDVRKIRPGNDYVAFTTKDSLNKLKYFVYEIDKLNFVVYNFGDSTISIYAGKKEVTTKETKAGGIVKGSLWGTMKSLGLSPVLAIKMSEILAWQIDFNTVRNGDKFKVIYNNNYIGDEFISTGIIKAIMFEHMGEKFYAFRFKQGNKIDYFDTEGGSMRKAFLKAPLKFTRISSRFTHRRFHPILHIYRPHLGIDFAAPIGTPVQSVGDGVVLVAQRKGAEGRFVKIRHNSTYSSGYMHLSRYGKGIKPGKHVNQGDIIGYVGSSGLSTGPHLDFRFWKNGTLVNYLTQKFPPSNPVKKKYMARFIEVRDSLIKELDKISLREIQPANSTVD